MTLLEPEELRYASISLFGLIIFTTILKWTGVGQTRFTPTQPGTSDAAQVADRSFLETIMTGSFFTSSPVNNFLDLILTPLQIVVDLLLTWSSVWNSLGWTSIFIIVPMFIMLVIIGGVAIKLIQAVLP